MVSDDFGWAVGHLGDYGPGGNNGIILVCENGRWDIESSGRLPMLAAVLALGRDSGLAVGYGSALVHFDGVSRSERRWARS